MLRRLVRPVLITLCILAGLGAAAFLWTIQHELGETRRSAAAAAARADSLTTGLTELGSALQAYVAPGQSLAAWAPRAAGTHARLTDELALLAAQPDAAPAADILRASLASLAAIDGRVREYLRSGDDLMAADLAFNEARTAIGEANTALGQWRAARQMAVAAREQAIGIQQLAAIGVMALAWALSLFALWRRPAPVPVGDAGTAAPVDLERLAAACGDLARAGDGEALRAAIGCGAAAIGARGAVVWLGVEESLFAVASHGYDERHLKRPIPRDAQNVTAETWRTGQPVTVAGDADAPGVVVVPMIGAGGCRGVVSAELQPGVPAGPEQQALLSLLAAQLVGLVGASAPAQAPQAQPQSASTVEQAS